MTLQEIDPRDGETGVALNDVTRFSSNICEVALSIKIDLIHNVGSQDYRTGSKRCALDGFPIEKLNFDSSIRNENRRTEEILLNFKAAFNRCKLICYCYWKILINMSSQAAIGGTVGGAYSAYDGVGKKKASLEELRTTILDQKPDVPISKFVILFFNILIINFLAVSSAKNHQHRGQNRLGHHPLPVPNMPVLLQSSIVPRLFRFVVLSGRS